MNETKRGKILTQLGLAQVYTSDGDVERTERACDTAIRILHDMGPCGMTLRQLNDACEAFLEETGFPTLAVAAIYIKSYREAEEVQDAEPVGAEVKEDTVAAWAEVFEIVGRYVPDGERVPIHCEHDEMWICVSPDKVSEGDRLRLEELGWLESNDAFKSFQSA